MPLPVQRFVPPLSVHATWLQLPLEQISLCELGPEFSRSLGMLCVLEAAYNFVNKTRGFAAKGRPAQLDAWVRSGRGSKGKAPPHVSSASTFAVAWWEWWLALQPEWRGSARPLFRGPFGEDWEVLATPGANAMLGALACLYWWGCNVQGVASEAPVVDVGGVEEWLDAVEDMNYVLEGLIKHAQSS
ncbi:hypothetical protein FIBSPDRAFT_758443 [Athelia psychrophila]|uniref:Uncharacterized protein n=1 Tax=Athelia psychrophila TaxID=1759441 RepID=A0A165ZAH3_9AGAM|nr:hypothetical protein FIBSPDRAFT_758443 [Fibularhizoctonia sp. CBS 109695]